MNTTRLSLRQLNLMVRDAIESCLSDEFWVEAELSEWWHEHRPSAGDRRG